MEYIWESNMNGEWEKKAENYVSAFTQKQDDCNSYTKKMFMELQEQKDTAMGFLSFSLLVLGLLQLVSAQQNTDPNEVAALRKIIDYWNLGSKLNLTVDPCSQNAKWTSEDSNPRVACDCSSNPCHITLLKIYALDIKGEIPRELFELKELMDLNLGQNVLNGSIPAEIGQLSKMQYLSLGINNVTGPVPPELGNLTKLLSLSFSSNNFYGPLPKELGRLTSLQQLYIDSSGVSGPIPPEFANLKSLQILWASDNLLTGKLPEFLGTFTEFRDMRLQGTSLEGPIPSSFAALTKLEDLRIGDLSGEDSSLDFLNDQTRLSTLSLRNCRLSGQLPEHLGRFTMLQYLYIGNNNLSGELPEDIITPELIALDVSFNPLSGNLPPQFAKVKSMNVVGTSIKANGLQDKKVSETLECLQGKTKCRNKVPSSSFSIKCGGTAQKSASGIEFDDDSEILGAASLYTSTDNQWAFLTIIKLLSVSEGAAATSNRKRVGLIAGIVIGGAAGIVIVSSIFYLWWKKDPQGHMRIFTDSPRKQLT
ncbi:hypothetical protein QUC31_020786 [Theobroma cacao]